MSILDNAKEIASALQEIDNPDLYKRVLALHSDIVGLVEENVQLRDENQELKEKIRLKDVMKFQEPFWYQEGDETPLLPRLLGIKYAARACQCRVARRRQD